jgi:iron(III) transport system ATP-binding protein
MRDGAIVQVGSPQEVYYAPADRWTAQFVGEVNILNGVADPAPGGLVDTELGAFDLARPAGRGSVRVAVRPEQLAVTAEPEDGNATVDDREFRGHDVLYRLRHDGVPGPLLVQLPSVELFAVGDRVRVRPGRGAGGPVV